MPKNTKQSFKLLIGLLLTISFFSFQSTPHTLAKTDDDKFVRTANYYLLSGSALRDANLTALSKYDLIVIPAEAQIYNTTFFSEIRSLNPDIVILAYVPSVDFNNSWIDPLHSSLLDGISNSWWLTNGSGDEVSVWPGTRAVNITSGWKSYLPQFVKNNIYNTGYWDGIFYDEVHGSISWLGGVDLDNNGSNDSTQSADSEWADAYEYIFSKTREYLGDEAIIIINGTSNTNFAEHTNGRMFETFPTPWEGSGLWQDSMQSYQVLQDTVSLEDVFVINSNDDSYNGQSNYQKVRYGLTSTSLGNGYFSYDAGEQSHAEIWYYDEYDAYLGKPAADAADLLHGYSNFLPSVWERDFQNGKVIVNSTTETQEIRLDGDYEKIHGTQDPVTNDGGIVSRITIEPQDGIVLLRPIEEINFATFINGSFVRIFDAFGQTERTGFFSYDNNFQGGTNVNHFDLDGDGNLESVVSTDRKVFIYNEDNELETSFYPYGEHYDQGINIAIDDLESDGFVEIITGTENGGGPHIRIFNSQGILINPGFFAYADNFRGGVNIATGDLNNDGWKEIVAGAGVGGGPHVRVFNSDGTLINPGFFAYDPGFRGGVNVATGDLDGNGTDEIITGPGVGGGPHIKTFSNDGTLLDPGFFAYDEDARGGVEVTAADIDGDGQDEIIGMSAEVFTISFE